MKKDRLKSLEEATLILDKATLQQKIRRIAYQILENNFEEKELVLAGVEERGLDFASSLAKHLKEISELSITLCQVFIDKSNPIGNPVDISIAPEAYQKKVVIVVDDVLNTGKTMMYAIQPFLDVSVKKLETAFLVNRSHKLYPVFANYTGYELATTIHDHILVDLSDQKFGVYLI